MSYIDNTRCSSNRAYEITVCITKEDLQAFDLEKKLKHPPLGVMPKGAFRKKVD